MSRGLAWTAEKILPFATHFSLAALEAQHLKGLREWDLGSFYDVEVEHIEAECEHNGVTVSFQEELPEPGIFSTWIASAGRIEARSR